ncbi:growth/differentiation factor 10 [Denticeps clupeoides]|uniref:TGF-beta family profile domain-containing protein n=1 Tax=Denticeps clupeoides TaxID=299321 RepID=A0AAY4CRQ4_9TELE|nr:growth/differentiation factor 10 [Denticeps clupeoides]
MAAASSLLFLAHLLLSLPATDATSADSEARDRASRERAPDGGGGGDARDAASANMYKIYDKFAKDHRQRDANTVRSFRAVPGFIKNKVVFQFNLTSIPDSEVILSATFHFLDQRHRPWSCRRSRSLSCRVQQLHQPTPSHLIVRGLSPEAIFPLGNISLPPLRKGHWQARNITSVITQGRAMGDILVSIEFDSGERHLRHQEQFPKSSLPYILVYADDLAITEPNSVAMSLQRYSPFSVGEDTASPNTRAKREANQIHSNFLPDVHHADAKSKELWENTYFPLKPRSFSKEGPKLGQEIPGELGKSQVLSFDEKTMKKARRRQWSEPRLCARRYLRVDFADIGWSEWVLAPKAFDAFYCAGACGFPIPKVVRPSNHATIQSIVKAVGIVPGIPEPCCVPDKMSALPVLFLDTSKSIVLKVYPNMSVDTCACR